MKHLLSIESMSAAQIREVLALARTTKLARRDPDAPRPLAGQVWGLIFSKSSTRTRVSFEVGIRELGGDALFLAASEIQLGRGEPIKDTARVLGRMLDGAVIRTFAQADVEEFSVFSKIPTVNALTDAEHPCQILADLQTIEERRGSLDGLKVAFIGDGDCNVARSWIWAAERLGFELRIAAPKPFQPDPGLMAGLAPGRVGVTDDLADAAAGVDVLYTDVWVSMGKEAEQAFRLAQLAAYQIDEKLVRAAAPGALVMHCLPAYRGKEITAQAFELHADTIFEQAENRLHAQKAVLQLLAAGRQE
jgi:ornithine carbamoyltransferase